MQWLCRHLDDLQARHLALRAHRTGAVGQEGVGAALVPEAPKVSCTAVTITTIPAVTVEPALPGHW